MFDNQKTKFLKTLLRKIDDCYDIGQDYINLDNGYSFTFEGFNIYIETYVSRIWKGEIEKDAKVICSKIDGYLFFDKLKNILLEKITIRNSQSERKRLLEKRLYEESMEEKYNEYTIILKGLTYDLGTKEFDEVMQDTKRLQEIAKEAKQIHSKYQKKFLGLF